MASYMEIIKIFISNKFSVFFRSNWKRIFSSWKASYLVTLGMFTTGKFNFRVSICRRKGINTSLGELWTMPHLGKPNLFYMISEILWLSRRIPTVSAYLISASLIHRFMNILLRTAACFDFLSSNLLFKKFTCNRATHLRLQTTQCKGGSRKILGGVG